MSFEEFMLIFETNKDAKRILEETIRSCKTIECRKCIETQLRKWFKKWIFGLLSSPIRVAQDIHATCLGSIVKHSRGAYSTTSKK